MTDGLAVAFARWRYGEERAADLSASPEERKEIEKALVFYLEAAAIRLTPGQNLGIALAGVYGPKVLSLELARREQGGRAEVKDA